MSNNYISLLLISIYKNIIEDKIISTFIDFLTSVNNKENFETLLKKYSDFISLLYDANSEMNLRKYVKALIYKDENILSKGCSDCINENEQILQTARYELSSIDKLLNNNYESIKQNLEILYPKNIEIISHLPVFYSEGEELNLNDILNSYKNNGYGIFSCYTAFKYNSDKQIIPIQYFDTITFDDLKNYKYQQDILKKNTLAFLNGKESNNILLYGDRGCGKSSSVKALINEYSDRNLKIIQVFKESFMYLGELFEIIRNLPVKFIIFADDISFNEDDKDFSSIKAVLEGSLSHKPENAVIYATTNRMHLVKESFSAREGSEIHYNDTIDETVSLSDRFGIMLTFSLLNKSEYLEIVEKIAIDCCVTVDDNLKKKAEEFSALKGIRTPRVARQFITSYIADSM